MPDKGPPSVDSIVKHAKIAGGGLGAVVIGMMGLLWTELGSIREELVELKIEASHPLLLERRILDLEARMAQHLGRDGHEEVLRKISLLEHKLEELEEEGL